MKNNKNKRTILATALMSLGLLFGGVSMAQAEQAKTATVTVLPPVVVYASSSQLTSNKVNLELDSINEHQEKSKVFDVKDVELGDAPYSILINKDGVQKGVNEHYKMALGDTLITVINGNNDGVKVRVMMESKGYHRTYFTDMHGIQSSINVFPATDVHKAFVLTVSKDDSVSDTAKVTDKSGKNRA